MKGNECCMLKALILGSYGTVGHVMTMYLERNNSFEVHNLSEKNRLNDKTVIMDVTNFVEFNNYLDANSFDVIINCIGIVNQFAESRKDKAILLNGYLPRFLEFKYKNTSTRVIQKSTDCVFSGKTGSYSENSFKDGDSFYARTKALGEIDNGKDLTVRTSVIGPDLSHDGIGLFNWFMTAEGQINGYVNAIWTGITTIQLAKAIECAIISGLTGLFNLVPYKNINKFELVNLLKSTFNRDDITINKYENTIVDKSLIMTKKGFNYQFPNYDEMLNEMKQWIKENKNLYPHYFNIKVFDK